MTLAPQHGSITEVMPNYNHFLQSAIYANLSPALANYLHTRGFRHGERAFKLFTFSRLMGKRLKGLDNGKLVFEGKLNLVISSPIDEFISDLGFNLLCNGKLKLGTIDLAIEGIEARQEEIKGKELIVHTLSPVVTCSTLIKPGGGKYTCYYQPGEGEFLQQITMNLLKKYYLWQGDVINPKEANLEIKAMGPSRQIITTFKGIIIKGYMCRLRIKGPINLLHLAIDAGLGAKNSMGFGCLEVERNWR
ncbi:CRISPR-associated endoribonuclease Cas6 [Neomoorella glycerini]|uniref:CRISPR-associated endoribonuclease Cas6 n=1 Tax=Neomoorella glycerini TaxID=55779 RepID=UPI001FE2504E|nr:CRISPR-associated endoribonuclease Cas6 [Moorella glycerini]